MAQAMWLLLGWVQRNILPENEKPEKGQRVSVDDALNMVRNRRVAGL